jgi:hypothetical protein
MELCLNTKEKILLVLDAMECFVINR